MTKDDEFNLGMDLDLDFSFEMSDGVEDEDEVYSEDEGEISDVVDMPASFNNDDNEFDFSQFYLDDEDNDNQEERENEEVLSEGVFADEDKYDEILNLNGDESVLKVTPNYPYLRVSGFMIPDEIKYLSVKLLKHKENIKDDSGDMLDVVFSVGDNDYIITKLPLNLDTMLTVMGSHRYKLELVRSSSSVSEVTSGLMKAFLFT